MLSYFPSFWEGLSLRVALFHFIVAVARFPFLFGGTFIEGLRMTVRVRSGIDFPSFSEGLSLRVRFAEHALTSQRRFPFLFGGTFIEALCTCRSRSPNHPHFPSFFGRAFIEAATGCTLATVFTRISLPFWRGFH